MGRRSRCNKSAADEFDNFTEYVPPNKGQKAMDKCLDDLFQKRIDAREEALNFIIDSFTASHQYQYAEKKFATILYRCLNSFKMGSLKESCLASNALGFLAITVGYGEKAQELYRESLPILSEALKSGSQPGKLISILNSLAVVTFVGGSSSEEIERSMLEMWQFVHNSSSKVARRNHSAIVQSAAISAWTLLLSDMDGWSISYKYWKGAIALFLDLLVASDETVRIAAGEALALIFEVGFLEKFASDSESCTDSSANESTNSLNGISSIQELKEAVLSEVRAKGQILGNISAKQKHDSDWDVMEMLEDGYFAGTTEKIGKQILKVDTWSQLLKMKFLKRFLGGGFTQHMLENELLQSVFNFIPKSKPSGREVYVVDREEVTVRCFMPEVKREISYQRIHKSLNSVVCKGKTQLRNKNRDIRAKELWSLSD